MQSSADPLRYATTYPWSAGAAGVKRSVGWHTLAFRGNTSVLEILVDGTVAKVGLELRWVFWIRTDSVEGWIRMHSGGFRAVPQGNLWRILSLYGHFDPTEMKSGFGQIR